MNVIDNHVTEHMIGDVRHEDYAIGDGIDTRGINVITTFMSRK